MEYTACVHCGNSILFYVVRPAAIVTSEQGEVINGVLELEYQRRRVLRCLPDQSSSQLIQNGSPVVGAWLVTEPGANINEEAISGFANTIANRSRKSK